MINLNGELSNTSLPISIENRGYKYGDALFETIRVVHGKILFWEDHYFRLMASMRILRMEIPMHFTMEFLSDEILKTIKSNSQIKTTARVRLNIDRGEGGKYLPKTKSVNFSIVTEALDQDFYSIPDISSYTVDLFKDYFVAPGLLSTLKSNNKIINVLGSVYAEENNFENCLLLNTNKNIVEALNGNIFVVRGETVRTPPLSDGCLNGIMRKQIIQVVLNSGDYVLEEQSISPFELQKADELFITNVIVGIQPILKYRKKEFKTKISEDILKRLNLKIRLG